MNTTQMREYAEFLEAHSLAIVNLCNDMEELLQIAIQCMDQKSGLAAAKRLHENIETIKANVPMADDAANRLILALKHFEEITTVFGR